MLIYDRQTPDTLARRRSKGIAQRGRDRRNTGFVSKVISPYVARLNPMTTAP